MISLLFGIEHVCTVLHEKKAIFVNLVALLYSGQTVRTLYQVVCTLYMCAEHVLLGDNEGLYLLDITGDNLFKFGDRDVRKVSQIRVMQEDNLVALLAGKEDLRVARQTRSSCDCHIVKKD